jgi:oligopeptide/dipeptide ABC transporter ATP-binding protein
MTDNLTDRAPGRPSGFVEDVLAESAGPAVPPAAGPGTDGAPLLEVRDLRVAFRTPERTVHAVNGVNFSLRAGRTLAVIGESGSGKTVASRAVMGLLPPTARVSGSALLLGEEMLGIGENALRARRGRDVAMIFQDPSRSLNPTMRIGTQIVEAIRTHLPTGRAEAAERAVELLRLVRVPAPGQRAREYPHQLSGGMRQRVMIAMALACHPRLLIADEATTALDVTTQAQVMDLLLDLQERFDMGLLLISHDMGIAATYADEVMVMYAGEVVERAGTTELFAHVRMPYTKVLLEAIPTLDREPHSLFPVVRARPPDLVADRTDCAFAPRCARAEDRCRAEHPALRRHERDHHWACHFPHGDEPAAPLREGGPDE